MGFDVTAGDAGTGQGCIFKTVQSFFEDSNMRIQHLFVIFVVCDWNMGKSSEPVRYAAFLALRVHYVS